MYEQKIVIVGAGIVGLATAYALLRQGMHHVTILEQAAVDHPRSTSRGVSRLLRFEYGDNPLYTRLVQTSLTRWQQLEHIAQRTLYTPTGVLMLGNESDPFIQASHRILREQGLPSTRLSELQCQQRFPQFSTADCDMFLYNAQGGILHASTILRILRDLVLDLGGEICEASHVKHIEYGNAHQPLRLMLQSGEEHRADRVVLAVGPWIHHVLGSMDLPVHITRQYLLYFANLPLASFGVQAFPAFLASELYGFPLHATPTGNGQSLFKAASHKFGMVIEPEENALIEELLITQVRKKLYDLLPALRHAQLDHVDACMYDVSDDEGFILDTLPEDSRVVFATGLSGHGFKFGLVLGEILSSLVQGTEPPVSLETFRLARFAGRGSYASKQSDVA